MTALIVMLSTFVDGIRNVGMLECYCRSTVVLSAPFIVCCNMQLIYDFASLPYKLMALFTMNASSSENLICIVTCE